MIHYNNDTSALESPALDTPALENKVDDGGAKAGETKMGLAALGQRFSNQWQLPLVGIGSFLILLYVGTAFAIYVLAVAFALSYFSRQEISRKFGVFIGFGLLLATIAVWKYAVNAAYDFGFFAPETRKLVVTLGVSYMGLRVADVYFHILRRRLINRPTIDILAYLAYTPTLPAGPLIRSEPFFEQFDKGLLRPRLIEGTARIWLGVSKKLVLINFLIYGYFGDIIAPVSNSDLAVISGLSSLEVLRVAIVLFLIAFIDISAYTDIAIGTSRILGIKLPEDMSFPLFRRNPVAFWRCWHVTVVNWCRDTVNFPVLAKTRNLYIATLLTFLFMGMWHQVNWQWFVWGIYQSIGIIAFIFCSQKLVPSLKRLVFKPKPNPESIPGQPNSAGAQSPQTASAFDPLTYAKQGLGIVYISLVSSLNFCWMAVAIMITLSPSLEVAWQLFLRLISFITP